MATHNWKIRLATMLLSLGCVGAVQAADRDLVPAILVDPVDPAATPEPICSVCAIVTKTREDSSTATMTITHDRDFEGDVELVVWLDSDERATVWIPAIALEGGDEIEVEVEAGEGWSWDDVQFAWTTLHPVL
jgi:hypothetical protein